MYGPDELLCLDFAHDPVEKTTFDSTYLGHWNQLRTLFDTLEAQECRCGYWCNRDQIACDTKGLVIAVDPKTKKQLGFLWAPYDNNEGVYRVQILHVFTENEQAVSTFLMDKFVKERRGHKIVIEMQLDNTYPFWAKWMFYNSYNPDITTSDVNLREIVDKVLDVLPYYMDENRDTLIKRVVKSHNVRLEPRRHSIIH